MPLQETSGAASYDAFGGGVPAVPNYIEDVFSTWLYSGTGAAQTITNGIDLSTKGGLVWLKERNNGFGSGHWLYDTLRGATNKLSTETTQQQFSYSTTLTAFNTSGFNLGSSSNTNNTSTNYASWTFRKQPKFFDVVTYTGNGTTQTVNHNLGSRPGFILCKATSTTGDWAVWHRGNGTTGYSEFSLNLTNAASATADATISTTTNFKPSSIYDANVQTPNVNGETYVAYIFAHNAGGFGLTGTDNVISCGSYTGTGANPGPVVTLGYEPQFVLVKSTGSGYWAMYDNMRGMPASPGVGYELSPNIPNAENALYGASQQINVNATGFEVNSVASGLNSGGATFIYIAIRRGPMKVPTDGTKVYTGTLATSSESAGTTKTTGFPIDLQIVGWRDTTIGKYVVDRLRSVNSLPSSYPSSSAGALNITSTSAEDGGTNRTLGFSNTGFSVPAAFELNNVVYWNFRRAPSFFDEVCYTGTGATANVNHNLGVAPELMIVKDRTNAFAWNVYVASLGPTARLELNTNATPGSGLPWNNTAPTSSVFTLSFFSNVNQSGDNYVAYLFATCAGVSKVGSYTGTGATQTIACGFAGGARFVLVKRTDTTGDWYVWDTARGMVSGTDPSLLLNSTAAEVNANSIYTTTGGFQIVSTAAGINASGGSYIFLAIA